MLQAADDWPWLMTVNGYACFAIAATVASGCFQPPIEPACLQGNGGCSVNATCTDDGQGPVCTCNVGWQGNGLDCADVDECAVANGGCAIDATCVNTPGSRSCTCNEGLSGDGTRCARVVAACAIRNGDCDANATCTNTASSRQCKCNQGFTGDGFTCADVDECATNNGMCGPNATCTNTPGSRTCTCSAGFLGDGLKCEPSCTDMRGDLVGYYPFDHDARDYSGNHNDGIGRNVVFSVGWGNGFAYFDVDSEVKLTGSTVLNGGRTFCAWFKNRGVISGPFLPILTAGGQAADIFGVTPGTSIQACPKEGNTLFIQRGVGSCLSGTPRRAYALNWNFGCWAADTSGLHTIFTDGQTTSGSLGVPTSVSISELTIGNNPKGTLEWNYFYGAMDEVTVWSRALTVAEMARLYGNGQPCRLQ